MNERESDLVTYEILTISIHPKEPYISPILQRLIIKSNLKVKNA